jgi:hypothetical protein
MTILFRTLLLSLLKLSGKGSLPLKVGAANAVEYTNGYWLLAYF